MKTIFKSYLYIQNTHKKAIISLTLLLLLYVLILNAWVVDDAYITFRTVDNFVNGRGLIWNPGERVQVFTHPLWMFVMSFFYSITSEFFFTAIVLSIILTLAAIFVVSAAVTQGFQASMWKIPLLLLLLISSKAFIDYASSGLENCLSYFIAAVFLVKFSSLPSPNAENAIKAISTLFFLASLAFVNRLDTILLYVPALLYLLWYLRASFSWRLIFRLLFAFSPAIIWELFSFIYYGLPFPNTAYAKNLATGFSFFWIAQRGVDYLMNSVSWDMSSHFILAGCAGLLIKERTPQNLTIFMGILLYMTFVVLSAASATHMSGRFFAVPFFMATVLLVTLLNNQRIGWFIGVMVSMYIIWHPISAVKFGSSLYHPYHQNSSYIDTKWFVVNEGAALVNWRPGKQMPDHAWYHEGERVKKLSQKLYIGGPGGAEPIGYFGFAAGHELYIIDKVGLSDPLLSKLPAIKPENIAQWKSGHFHRNIPEGYAESIINNRNMIQDEKIRQYYEVIRILTRNPIFNWSRLGTIWAMNTGQYNYLIK